MLRLPSSGPWQPARRSSCSRPAHRALQRAVHPRSSVRPSRRCPFGEGPAAGSAEGGGGQLARPSAVRAAGQATPRSPPSRSSKTDSLARLARRSPSRPRNGRHGLLRQAGVRLPPVILRPAARVLPSFAADFLLPFPAGRWLVRHPRPPPLLRLPPPAFQTPTTHALPFGLGSPAPPAPPPASRCITTHPRHYSRTQRPPIGAEQRHHANPRSRPRPPSTPPSPSPLPPPAPPETSHKTPDCA